jgi:hypothetical protein
MRFSTMQVALRQPASPDETTRPAIDVTRPVSEVPIDVALRKMAAAAKTSPLGVVREFVGLAFGPGQVSFADYQRLRLFDAAFYAGSDKRAVVGQKRNININLTVNYRHDWMGLFANKIASESYLAAYGFPTIPTVAIYAEKLASASPRLIRDQDELRSFLTSQDPYPIFGKPTEGLQSLGSVGLKRYIPSTQCLERIDGDMVPLEGFLSDVLAHYADGYVFQKLLSPHPDIRALCGDRLATVRVVTIAVDDGPKVFRACWKIPAGPNIADNYWRSGNLLAQIDPTSGRVLRAMSGAGLDLVEHTFHPDTKAPLVGAQVPKWQELIGTAVEAAKLMRQMPLIGWDMTVLETGPIIVEMNEQPDFFLNQLADGRGVLDAEFLAFMEVQKRKGADRVRAIKRESRQL